MKRKCFFFQLVVLTIVQFVLIVPASSKPGKLVVLVPPFENLSRAKSMISYEVATSSDPNQPKRSFRVDRYSEAPRAILEDILVSMGVSVVERQRLDAILLESELGRHSGLVDTAQAIRVAKMLGATAIFMGTITDIRTRESTFSGYGIRTKKTEVIGALRVRLIDTATGLVGYSNTLQGSATYDSSSFGGVTNSDVAFEVIQAALEKLREDREFKQSLVGNGNADRLVRLSFQVDPI